MINLIKRNLSIYFANRSVVFFSVFAALISFVLYLLFLKNSMQQGWRAVPGAGKLLDPWLIGGTLSVTGLTSIGAAISQMVIDREQHRLNDLEMTDLSTLQIQTGYLVGAVLIGTLNQIIAFLIMSFYFQIADGVSIAWDQSAAILGIAVFSSLVWTALNLLIYSFINRQQSVSTISSIIGTVSGFMAGVYVPISTMPSVAQTIMKFTPAPYVSAAFRDVVMKQQLHDSFKHLPTSELKSFRLALGIDLKVGSTQLTMTDIFLVLGGFLLIFIVLLLLANYLRTKEVAGHAR
ncbi:ABC transporter permease [Lactobacillus sp. Sy-1]|uniref:ABC transporter permease n=1 Tax=Lactobacillus sp. Sy-1 TaxID=2109645 RepID=UPI001C586B83|nr:ABC transporter permease [Lactobacillus sp. Sy-1]MBW1605089.1 ABC transporter permease [Lactobacillus sp. Sy-1]